MSNYRWLLPYLVTIPAGLVLSWRLLVSYIPWLVADIRFIRKLLFFLKLTNHMREKKFYVCDKLIENAEAIPNKSFILFEDQTFSYKQINNWANQCARCFKNMGCKPCGKIGLMMMNEPAFVAVWMGCNRIGVTTGFLNYNLRSKALLHCINIAEVNIIIVGNDQPLIEAIIQISDELKEREIQVFVYGENNNELRSISKAVEKESKENVPTEWKGDHNYEDPICYIYTSGTTGLPKAVNMNNRKCWQGSFLLNMGEPNSDDVIYTCLPLYHSAASAIGLTGAIFVGATIALRKKFSASHFWSDIRKFNCTIVQYIGEILRYVCKLPYNKQDKEHNIRFIIGNGLRTDVWKTFLDRYGKNIRVLEFYAATEGNVGFFNLENKIGSIGMYSPLIKRLGGGALVKFDVEKEEMIRDKSGRAIYADFNEPALLLGLINEKYAISSYKGAKSLTEKKILHNVFKKGDKYFNTGDLLTYDEEYCVHFCDRIGDTFRWKGENVSTNEVSDTVVQAPGVKEANVYGVQIGDLDGRAGMASLVLDEDQEELNIPLLYNHVTEYLPSYAQPIFIRVQVELELTGTWKQRKVNLKQQGYDLNRIGNDKLYLLDHKQKTYVAMTEDLQKGLDEGTIRV